MKDREKIDSCKEIFVTNIYEPKENQLVIEIALGRVSEIEKNFRVSNSKVFSGRQIFFDESSEKYRLFFDSYISYWVVNEGFEKVMAGKYSGNRIREYEESSFIDFCREETTGFAILEGIPTRHFMLVSQNHIINILTVSALDIQLLD